MAKISRTIGVRELKARASAVLREVQTTGAEFIVTVHGRPVARLEALGEGATTAVDGMGNTRGAFSDWPDLTWEDFQEAKRIWDPRPLDDE